MLRTKPAVLITSTRDFAEERKDECPIGQLYIHMYVMRGRYYYCYYYLFIHASVSPIGRLAAVHCGTIGQIVKYLHASPTAAGEMDDIKIHDV